MSDCRQLMTPRVGKLGEPVAEDDRGPFAGFVNSEANRRLIRTRRELYYAALWPGQSGHQGCLAYLISFSFSPLLPQNDSARFLRRRTSLYPSVPCHGRGSNSAKQRARYWSR